MDEMNNMNEVTTEETSNEMTPVVTENNEVKTEENSGINTWAGVAAAVGVLTIGAIGAGIAKHKAKAKTEPKVEKEKEDHRIHRQPDGADRRSEGEVRRWELSKT